MKGIDPKYMMYLGLLVTIEQAIGHGTVSLTNLVPADWAPYITSWCNFLAFVGTAIMTYQAAASSQAAGPLIDVPKLPTIVKILLIMFLPLVLVRPDPAMAQTKSRGPQFTGDVVADIKANTAQAKSAVTGQPIADPRPVDVWKAIMTAALPDLVYSSALSSSAGTPASKIRKQCWDALIAANKQAQGTDLKDEQGNPLAKPDPHFFTDVELLAETIDNLSPTGPLFTSCAGAAEMARMSVLQFINAAVTGAAGFAMLGL